MMELIPHSDPVDDPELINKLGAITNQLLKDLPADKDARARTLLERTLRYAAESEQRMADQMARISQLEFLSNTDALTGLLNRRGFCDHLGYALGRARRYGETGVIAYCDLDTFKSVNDAFGHSGGDALLIRVGDALAGSVRDIDIVGRLGGDEFGVVLVNTNWKDGAKRLRSLHWKLDNTAASYRGHDIPVQVSVGVEPYGPHDNPEELLHRADMAMYYNKRRKHAGPVPTAAE
jgi:diguanylate cyclase (GGDEF)-like protein